MALAQGTPRPAEPDAPLRPTPAPLPGADRDGNPLQVSDLALPFDPDEVAAVLAADPRLQLRFRHKAFVFSNCATLAYLGDAFEIYTHFREGAADAPAPPRFAVYAPADMTILRVWGTPRYRLMLNARLGTDADDRPTYLSVLTLSLLGDDLASALGEGLGVAPEALDVTAGDVGPFLLTSEYAVDRDDERSPEGAAGQAPQALQVRRGELLGWKTGPWEWYPTCETEHTMSIHVQVGRNDGEHGRQALERSVPDTTRHYLNLLVREMVIERGFSLDVEYRTRNVGDDHGQLAQELFDAAIAAQVHLIPWEADIHPWRFTVIPGWQEPVRYTD